MNATPVARARGRKILGLQLILGLAANIFVVLTVYFKSEMQYLK